jgi:hypothetical protein
MYTEVPIATWQNIHLMHQSTRNARLQSLKMHSQNAFTTWQIINLMQQNIRKYSAALETKSPPKR